MAFPRRETSARNRSLSVHSFIDFFSFCGSRPSLLSRREGACHGCSKAEHAPGSEVEPVRSRGHARGRRSSPSPPAAASHGRRSSARRSSRPQRSARMRPADGLTRASTLASDGRPRPRRTASPTPSRTRSADALGRGSTPARARGGRPPTPPLPWATTEGRLAASPALEVCSLTPGGLARDG